MKWPFVQAGDTERSQRPPLARDVEVGPYRILSWLGSGGMGEVYRAVNLRLERQVALKVIRGEDALRVQSIGRFDRERNVLLALNHPGIVGVLDKGESRVDGEPILYLAMDLVEGPSLAEELRRGRPGLKRTLELAGDIAEALAAAHDAGILHRDLKPSNILITEDGEGHPKLVDFGLAKQAGAGSAGDREAETFTSAGEVVGTAGYMSPEQARGGAVEPPSDQFAFGCVLYEMLTGRRAFDAGSVAETLSSVLRDEPAPVESIAPEVPVPLRWILSRCLAKSPTHRYASTADLARELRTLRDSYSDLLTGAHVPAEGRRWKTGAAIAGVLAIAVGTALAWSRPPPPAKSLDFLPLTFRSGLVSRALFTPKSNGILFAAAWDRQPMRMYQTIAESVGFDRSLDSPVQFPLAYSEDGAQVLVLLGVAREINILRGTLAWWPALGGTPRPLLEDAGWSDWAPRSRRLAVVRDTGTERVLELRDENGRVMRGLHSTRGAITWVRFSPDEQRIAFIRLNTPYGTWGQVWSVDISGGNARSLTPPMSHSGGLDWHRTTGDIWFTASASADNPWSSTLCRVDAAGAVDYVHSFPGQYSLQAIDAERSRWLITSFRNESAVVVSVPPRPPERRRWFGWSVAGDLSPDGGSYLFYDGGAGEKTWGLWIRPLAGGDAFRVGAGTEGRFSPDGRWVVAADTSEEVSQIVVLPVAAGETRTLTTGTASYSWPSFDGPDAVLAMQHDGVKTDVVRVRIQDGHVEPLGIGECEMPSASPVGKALACVADAGRQVRLHSLGAGAPPRTLAILGHGQIKGLRWHRNGREIHAMTSDRRLITINADRGEVVGNGELADPEAGPYDRLISGAIDDRGQARIYSVVRATASLLLGTTKVN